MAWITVAVAGWATVVAAVRYEHPKLCVSVVAVLCVLLVLSLVDTAVADQRQPADGRRLVLALLLLVAGRGGAWAVKRWLAEGFSIASGAMIPALLVGDHLMVSKGGRPAQRGDVVVFESPLDRSTRYVKRVVALGGDTVEVIRGVVSINGTALQRVELPEECPREAGLGACQRVRESNGGRSYTIMITRDQPAADLPRTTVPQGEVFVLGDNRDSSHDSRHWGGVPAGNVTGRATVITTSVDPTAGFRWSRLGHRVD